jgi:hypothetical protein
MRQVVRSLTTAEGFLAAHCVLICDRDAKWSHDIREQLGDAGIAVAQTPARAPNANAHAERFVRSIKTECLARIVPVGERHFRRALAEYVAHYHVERNHQGLGNVLIAGRPPMNTRGRIPKAETRRTAQLLRARRVMGSQTSTRTSIEWWDSTGFSLAKTLEHLLSIDSDCS